MVGAAISRGGRVLQGGGGMRLTPDDILKPGGEIRFYNSVEWRATRREVLKRDRHECQRCKREGLYKRADCVHHVLFLKDRPDLALMQSNLTSLCNSCHDKEHHEKFGYEKPFENLEWF